jgi:hypothetical protein
MSTQIALTFAAISSGLLAGFFLALAIVVNLVLSSGSGDITRIALRTAFTTGILGAVAALSTLGAILTHLNAPNAFNVIGPAIVAVILIIIGAALGVVFGSNSRHSPSPGQIAGFRQSNWGAMAVSVVAFVLIIVALGTLP